MMAKPFRSIPASPSNHPQGTPPSDVAEDLSRAGLIVSHATFYGAFLAVASLAGPVALLPAAVLGPLLVWISVIDAESCEIPDEASVLLAANGLAFAWLWVPDLWPERMAAALLWPALFWLVSEGYARLRGREGLGFGDVKLMVGIGLWTGVTGTTQVVLAAALAAILTVLLAAWLRGLPRGDLGGTGVPFGPFLCFATWAVWLLGGT